MPTTTEYERSKAINDDYRSAAMNRKYYACRLTFVRRSNLVLEVLVAVGTSAAVGAWAVWKSAPGFLTWQILAAVATLLAVAKPFLRLGKEIERYSELFTGYSALFYDLDQLILQMKTSGCIGDECWKRFIAIRDRTKDLGMRDDPSPRKRLHRKCFEEVKREIPADTLWWATKETE